MYSLSWWAATGIQFLSMSWFLILLRVSYLVWGVSWSSMKDKEKQHWLSFHEMVASALDGPSSKRYLLYTVFSPTMAPACEGYLAG